MNRTSFLILLALLEEERHGYEISKFIEQKTNGFFKVPFGSLYPALHKLEADKLIKAEWQGESEKPVKIYSLSARGRESLSEEIGTHRSTQKAFNMLIPKGI